ncbi:amidohydrolase [Sinomonas cellulolyticus]|uniref:amidohydrolase family protein n=1 Tax=Sinomonas cellulolyticus TaxID=2801916 RepID=UPI001986D5F2|nr:MULTISPECIES: amidohydrolase family protein [Sinomonas]GHG60868.1 amidohydrolase [Sinomonas sp. KCTC 49339]
MKTQNTGARRIDTHHHVVPDFYRKWLTDRGLDAGGLPIPVWEPGKALDFMDSTAVQTAILSVSTPGVEPASARGELQSARSMARQLNEYSADLARDHPGRFGFFATLTLPDVDGALEELDYALGTLKADGIVLLANTNGVYLGDPAFDELFDELDLRSAVVFVHPSHLPAPPVPGLAPYVADFLLDTTRAAANLVKSGTTLRCPSLKIILSHAGGFVPFAAARMAANVAPSGEGGEGLSHLRRFYFDTALSASPYALPSLLAFADPDHILYGSDYPYAAPPRSKAFTQAFDDYTGVDHNAVNRDNAVKLFPRFA